MKWLFFIGSKPFFSCFITGKLLSRNTDAVFSAIADGTFVYCVFKLNKFIYCKQLQSFLVISHNSNPPLWLFVTAIIPPCRRYNQYKTNCKGKRNENNYKQAFAENLVALRLQHGLSQYKLVEKMQLLGSTMSRSTYSKIELGAGNLKVSDLIALKQIYNADYAEFFEGISIDEKENE